MFDKIVIIDQSVTTPEPEVVSSGNPKAFFPIFSKRGYGKDTDIKLFTGGKQATLISKYGKPDLSTDLAPIYYAYEYLRGGGDAYIRRVVSATASPSYAVIVAKGRVVVGTPEKYETKFVVQTLTDVNTVDEIIAAAEALLSTTPDADGYAVYPIAVFGLNWAGAEGDKYTFRLLQDKVLEKVVDQRCYQIEIKPDSATTPTTVEFSINSDAILDDKSIYANDIFSSTYPDAYFTVLNTYKTFLSAISTYIPTTEKYVDIFFGMTKGTYTAYPSYTFTEDSADFTAVGGISLAGGSDGAFVTSSATRETDMMTEYAAVFETDGVKALLNEYKYHIDFIYNFGADATIKTALSTFVGNRKTTSLIDDTGTEKIKTSILTERKTGNSNYNDMNISVMSGVAAAIDPFTKKKIVMPLSYFEAYAAPHHILTYEGGARPFAGDLYKYENMIAGTYQPYFYSEDDSVLEEFVSNRINFAFEDTNGYTAYHQSTSLTLDSALGERNNVYLLHKVIRIGLRTAKAERWNWSEDSDIEKYEAKLIRNVSFEMDGKFGSIELTAEREGLIGPSKNRVAVTATIRFKYINKGTTFKFIVV